MESMQPWATCYQQAWPLQLDLQIYLLVPWIAMIFWKWPKLGMAVSALLVLANMVINIVVADRYGLKIGWVDVDQYYILVALLSKPWTKLCCVGFGGLMAFFYFNVRRYREIENLRERALKFRRINHLMTSKRLGKGFLWAGVAIVLYQITQESSYFENPQHSSKELNLLYYAIRPAYIAGVMLILMSIISGSFNLGKACLSNQVFRIISRSLAAGCVLQVAVIQLIYMSTASGPSGVVISWPNILWIFVGQLFIIPLAAFAFLALLEQPILRVTHLTLLPYLSHDYMLMNFHDIKNGMTSHVSGSGYKNGEDQRSAASTQFFNMFKKLESGSAPE